MCTAAWLPSTSTGTPIARAPAQIARTSTTVPSTFDMCVTAMSFVRGPTAASTRSGRATVRLDLHPFQHHPLPLAQEVPGHDVGVMLHHREHDLVPGLEPRRRPGVAHHVDPHGRAGGEDDLVLVPRAEKALHDAARRLVLLRRHRGKIVQPPVDVGIFLGICPHLGVDDGLRLLRRGAVVEIDERPPVHLARRGSGSRAAPSQRRTSAELPERRGEEHRHDVIAKKSASTVSSSPASTTSALAKPCSSAMKASRRPDQPETEGEPRTSEAAAASR